LQDSVLLKIENLIALGHIANTQLNNNFNNKAQVAEAALAHF
jgi:hypothetical protein